MGHASFADTPSKIIVNKMMLRAEKKQMGTEIERDRSVTYPKQLAPNRNR